MSVGPRMCEHDRMFTSCAFCLRAALEAERTLVEEAAGKLIGIRDAINRNLAAIYGSPSAASPGTTKYEIEEAATPLAMLLGEIQRTVDDTDWLTRYTASRKPQENE